MFADGVSAAPVGAAARRRRARAVHGHRPAGAAPREAARPRRRLAGASRRWRRRRARRSQRGPQPGPHRVDRGRADDRAHARDRRGGARRRHDRRDEVGDHQADPRRLRDRRQRRPAVPGRRGRRARGDPGRRPRHRTSAPTTRSCRASRARSAGSTPPRSRTSTRSTGRPAPTGRSGSSATDGALVTKSYADDKHLTVGSQVSLKTPKGDTLLGRRPRHLRPAGRRTRCWPTCVVTQAAFDAAYSQPKNSFTFLDADAGSAAAIKAAAEGLRRRQATTPAPPTRRTRPRTWPGRPGDALRAARLLGHREPVRHGQHDGAVGVRAHPRDRDAPDDRHDAPPGAAHDPPREHHHRADRRGARTRARAVPRRRS